MKSRFSTFDIICMARELQSLIGMRVVQVYDIDRKTYLIKLQRNDEKQILVIESGIRFHTTQYDWPKNIAPSGFCMKMRKHLRNKRLEKLVQIGSDRIIDMQFGSGEVAHHIILELFDRGNILLTDHLYCILNVLRPHTEGDRFKFAVREVYPTDRARNSDSINKDYLVKILSDANDGVNLKKILLPNLDYGPSLLEHVFHLSNLPKNPIKGKHFLMSNMDILIQNFTVAENILEMARMGQLTKGYIFQKRVEGVGQDDLLKNETFHPFKFEHDDGQDCKEFDSFSMAVDDFFSNLESQKHEIKATQLTREAMKKVERIREDQTLRVQELDIRQDVDRNKAELITRNYEKVDAAILGIRSAIAAQMSWSDIQKVVDEAVRMNDEVAGMIKKLKLETNHISLHLSDPCAESEDEQIPDMIVDINLDYSAHANATRYYVDKKSAAIKQKKTIESQEKALKSAHKKALQVIKQVNMMTAINKSRKTFWFEKFFWFISSENYLVIGGRDQQQNEILVKRYMKPGDIYVHADITGASSIIIKNPSGNPVPPKTLSEAGTMAICYSIGWAAKVVCSSWWVHSDQVSKTAPSGEYLTTGSFMIRGKKNFMTPSQLAMGFAFLFRVEESSSERHKDERCVRTSEDIIKTVEDLCNSFDEVNEIDINPEDNSDSEGNENEFGFPDSNLTLVYTSTEMNLKIERRGSKEEKNMTDHREVSGNILKVENSDQGSIIYANPLQRIKKNNRPEKKKETLETDTTPSKEQSGIKRGQRSKLKKIKEKYKDQDEEEKQLRMSILQSAGGKKNPRRKKNGETEVKKPPKPKNVNTVKKTSSESVTEQIEDVEDNDIETEPLVSTDLDMLRFLTGQPHPEDEILFAVPVVGPYSTFLNYKYKIKLIPGSTKRGKAAQTCIEVFSHYKECTQREKDLMRSVNADVLTRNMPGKVKLSVALAGKLKK